MRFYLLTLFVLLHACFTTLELTAQPPEVSGYQVNWFDDFDGNGLDTNKWTAVFSDSPTNNSLHIYLPQNVLVSGGKLRLLSTDQQFGLFDYRSGQVISNAAQRYGRFEVRGKLPTSRGMWPAIWLLPDAPWPSQGEIDIMENRGNQPHLTSSAFHWGTNPPFSHQFVYSEQESFVGNTEVNYHDSYHTYAAEWDPTQIRYYIDGVHWYTVRNGNVGNFMTNSQSAPMRLIINTAIGGHFLPDPDESTQWPQLFEVEYAYLYNRVGDPVLELENGGFEKDGPSLSDWRIFGSTGSGNIQPVSTPTDSGDGALKLFGQFLPGTNYSGVEQGTSVEPGQLIQAKCRTYIDSADTIAGTANEAVLKFDFYNTLYGEFGTDEYISSESVTIATSTSPNDQWIEHTLNATVPANAVEARVTIVFAQQNFNSGSVFVDSVQFNQLSTDETIVPETATVDSGDVASGDVAATQTSDDQYLEVLAIPNPDLGQLPIEVVFESSTVITNPNSIDLVFESSANTPNLVQILEAYNYVTQQFEVVTTSNMETTDSTLNVSLTGILSRFVRSSDGQMRLRARYSATSTVVMFPWKSRIDAVSLTVSQ